MSRTALGKNSGCGNLKSGCSRRGALARIIRGKQIGTHGNRALEAGAIHPPGSVVRSRLPIECGG